MIPAVLRSHLPPAIVSALRTLRSPPIGRRCVTFNALGRAGRLGNQLFQIAATIAVARKCGVPYVFPEWEAARFFEHPLPSYRFTTLPNRRYHRAVPTYVQRTFSYEEIEASAPLSLRGNFQSERYFAAVADEVRRVFEPKARVIGYLRGEYAAILETKPWSLHIRRGDYVDNPLYADLARSDYYANALRHVPDGTAVVVISDDIEWARGRFAGERFHYSRESVAEHDLFLMGLCAGNIIANSSFSWWGAWLGEFPGKPIVAPRAWFAGSRADRSVPFSQTGADGEPTGFHDTRDLIPARWRRV